MYDNLLIKIQASDLNKSNLITELADLNFEKTVISKNDEIIKLVFSIKNLRVTIKKSEILIFGSIAKYFYGTNQYTLTLADTKKAFDMLSQDLGITVNNFWVVAMEFGANLIMDYPVSTYYQFLGEHPTLSLNPPVAGTRYYDNNEWRIIFYDKIKETKECNEDLDVIPEFEDQNVLRYEVKYKKRFAKRFDRNKIKVEDLYSPIMYKVFIEDWHKQFSNIYKYRLTTFEHEVFKDVRELKKQLLFIGIQTLGGQAEVLSMIQREHDKNRKKMGYTSNRTRLRDFIIDAYKDPILTKESDEIKELELKINKYADQQLSTLTQFLGKTP